jgi:dephospho-CoA kinase
MVYTVALIGGIACGKSTALNFFSRHNIPCASADVFAKTLLNQGTHAYQVLLTKLGHDYLNSDGEFDRSKLRKLLLEDKDFKIYLESLLHPLIQQQMLEWQKNLAAPYCVLEIPLLQDKKSYLIDRVLCIQSDSSLQKLRLKQRMLDDGEIQGLLAVQIPHALRLKLADDVIDNDGTIADFENQLNECHQKYLKLSQAVVQKTS